MLPKNSGEMDSLRVQCACGCKQLIQPFDNRGRAVRFMKNHFKPQVKSKPDIPKILCKCGCGTWIPERDKQNRKREYAYHHHRRNRYPKTIVCGCGCGQELTIGKDGVTYDRHYIKGHRRKKEISKVYCACDCGGLMTLRKTRKSRKRTYLPGHQNRKPMNYGREISCACGCGEIITEYRYREDKNRRRYRYKVKYQIGHGVRGERNHFWKGGVTEQNENERVKFRYKHWRQTVMRRDNWTCQRCEARNKRGLGKTVVLHVDHIKSFADYPKLRYELDNGRTLCMGCHYFITYGRELPQGKIWALRPGKVLDNISNIRY